MTRPPASTVLLTATGLRKRFGPTVALGGVDLRVRAGEIHALVGENGAGKSTLTKILAGVHRPDAGTMTLADAPFAPRSPMDALHAGVAMVYQELSLAPDLSVAENIALGREPRRNARWVGLLDRRRMLDEARRVLADLHHPDLDPRTRVARLPVALQQVVEIARALARPTTRLLILDEPTSSLSREDAAALFAILRRLRERGLGIVYISHFLEEVRQLADGLTVLRDGVSVHAGPVADVDDDAIIEHMVGRQIEQLYPRSAHVPGDVVLRVESLAGEVKPRDASLELRGGEVLGIAGLVGAGRTELLRAIVGLDRRRDGRVWLRDRPLPASPPTLWKRGVGMLSEDRKGEGLATSMSIADNLTLPALHRSSPPPLRWPRRQEAASAGWVDELAIRCDSPRQRVAMLSGGNQQKVAIARLLEADVDVLLLDEPTRGIDVGSRAAIYGLIDQLALAGKAVLIVSSDLPELFGVCDRLAVMRDGQLSKARPIEQWTPAAVIAHAANDAAPSAPTAANC